jgi:hypothetical protein
MQFALRPFINTSTENHALLLNNDYNWDKVYEVFNGRAEEYRASQSGGSWINTQTRRVVQNLDENWSRILFCNQNVMSSIMGPVKSQRKITVTALSKA